VEFHGEIGQAILHADILDLHDVGVAELGGEGGFLPEAGFERRVIGVPRLQDLEGQRLAVIAPDRVDPREPSLPKEPIAGERPDSGPWRWGLGIHAGLPSGR
jgi:hypothetical protein